MREHSTALKYHIVGYFSGRSCCWRRVRTLLAAEEEPDSAQTVTFLDHQGRWTRLSWNLTEVGTVQAPEHGERRRGNSSSAPREAGKLVEGAVRGPRRAARHQAAWPVGTRTTLEGWARLDGRGSDRIYMSDKNPGSPRNQSSLAVLRVQCPHTQTANVYKMLRPKHPIHMFVCVTIIGYVNYEACQKWTLMNCLEHSQISFCFPLPLLSNFNRFRLAWFWTLF